MLALILAVLVLGGLAVCAVAIASAEPDPYDRATYGPVDPNLVDADAEGACC
jgi:hypothetical protein